MCASLSLRSPHNLIIAGAHDWQGIDVALALFPSCYAMFCTMPPLASALIALMALEISRCPSSRALSHSKYARTTAISKKPNRRPRSSDLYFEERTKAKRPSKSTPLLGQVQGVSV